MLGRSIYGPGRRLAASLVKRLGAFCKNINPSASVAAARRSSPAVRRGRMQHLNAASYPESQAFSGCLSPCPRIAPSLSALLFFIAISGR
ncbi:LOW QUALITY PROTEIN: uncharacterized protein Dana_GF27826 [Drosophila ananassae]|uniref:Uncharacterized protein n=1 Tax=Drosophila ananassae TaxID=7217 RepID=A0A0P9AJA8_DROAN|nr:LOW QUALITY PROTEIN: uncharacterized protein Dana_GF27826 [Drosophila ananassae]